MYRVPSHQQGVVELEGEPLPSVHTFKYLGSVIYGSGGCGKDVDGRIKVAWSRWRDLTGVSYDKNLEVRPYSREAEKKAAQNSAQTGDGVRE